MAERPPRPTRIAGPVAVQVVSWQDALRPLLRRVGGEVVVGEPATDDVPIEWLGEVLFHVRVPQSATTAARDDTAAPPAADTPVAGAPTDFSDALARLIASVEDEFGGALDTLSRAEKHHAVRLLEERGAFEMRRSAETVAEALGLTRFTVYNYLNRMRDQSAEPAG